MNKYKILTGLLLMLCAMQAHSQIVTGNSLYVKIGTVFSVDSLVFIPTEDLNLGNNYSLKVEHTAVPGSPNASIKKKYVFNNPVNFEGNLGVIYDPVQLNGNTESLLELANSMSDETAFVTLSGSTRDLAKHLVSKDVSGLDIGMLTLVNGQSALPVTLVDFSASRQENAVKLSWKTSFEANSDFFEIQRSANAKDWQALDRVASAGESRQATMYDFTDHAPVSGDNYYRLKMADRDGTFAFSQIRKVSWDGDALTVFPNPAADRLEVTVKDWSKVVKVSVLDAAGHMVKDGGAGLNARERNVPVSGLTAGSYILRVEYRDGSSERTHFIKY
ncbi:hypothetical protein GCM10010967_05600 [Dyadobacter beijingensis]|uniref:Secretion system C-terminal sorting domain-containing protein n=1 Tax=Dyadobacter beijingensis TaxID=365489 RepID=A0ABQ2HFN3_9BACT|nr:T9SS type A sorting domain-containing protein [Dyadobacter beijingensis]GGM76861.1 hypothetical protein GCM10010967_05600 [Dyadobacter beijingensis]